MFARAILSFAFALPLVLAQNADQTVIEGTVTSAVTHTGVAGVTVRVHPVGTGPAANREMLTDAAGHFRFADLKRGSYGVSFEKDGYFVLEADGPRVFPVGTEPVRLEQELAPWAKLSGSVRDPDGKPIAGVKVALLPMPLFGGTVSGEDPVTDAEGRFEFGKLMPGTYDIRAKPPLVKLVDSKKPTDIPADNDERREMVVTYFPGATERTQAQKIVVAPGVNLTGQEVRLQMAAVRAVRGVVLDENGRPKEGVRVELIPAGVRFGTSMQMGGDGKTYLRPGASEAAVDMSAGLNTNTQAGGAFEFRSVQRGEWQLIAEFQAGGGTDEFTSLRRGSERIRVSGRDVEHVEIRMMTPFAVPVSVDWGGSTPSKNNVFGIVILEAEDGRRIPGVGMTPTGEIQIQGVISGNYRVIALLPALPTHYMAAIQLGGRNVTNEPVFLTPGAALRIMLKPNPGRVLGTVEKASENAKVANVLVWPVNGGDGALFHSVTCDAQGGFRDEGLRPGDYYAVAVDRVSASGFTSDLLARLTINATRVRVDEGSTATVQLKLQRWQ